MERKNKIILIAVIAGVLLISAVLGATLTGKAVASTCAWRGNWPQEISIAGEIHQCAAERPYCYAAGNSCCKRTAVDGYYDCRPVLETVSSENSCYMKTMAAGETVIYRNDSIKVINFDSDSAVLKAGGLNIDFTAVGQFKFVEGSGSYGNRIIWFVSSGTRTVLSESRILLAICPA